MAHFTCIVQDQSAAHRLGETLEQRLQQHHAGHFPDDAATVSWLAVPAGYMFTEGRPSTSSVISCTLAHATTRDTRETYMRGVCDLWTEITGCTDHEIVVSITESAPVPSAPTRQE